MTTPTTWDDALDQTLADMHAIMVERQAKYGPTNISQQGLYGVITRASADKIARIKGALNGHVTAGEIILDPIIDGSEAADTFEDGLIDAANYLGPISLMLHRGWWNLPRKDSIMGKAEPNDLCHCPASTARDGHIHKTDGSILCLHTVKELVTDCPQKYSIRNHG